MSSRSPTGVMVRTYRPPESSSSGGQQAGAMEVGAETEPSEGRGHFSPGSGRCGWGLGRAVGRVGARGCAVPTGAGDVESHALCPGAVARQRGCPHPGRVVPGGQQGQVDAPKLGISEAGHTQHCGLLRATQNSWLGGGCGRQVGLAPGGSSRAPTSPRRRYLISYLRMRPLGSDGSSQRRRTLLLLAASQATFPGIPSASPVGEGVRQLSHRHRHMLQCDSLSTTDPIQQWSGYNAA